MTNRPVAHPHRRLLRAARLPLWLALAVLTGKAQVIQAAVLPADQPFEQEIHVPHPLGQTPAANDVNAVAVDAEGTAWAATLTGGWRLPRGAAAWAPIAGLTNGPAFAVAVDAAGSVWFGTWAGLHAWRDGSPARLGSVTNPIAAIAFRPAQVLAAGPDGAWRIDARDGTAGECPGARGVRAALADPRGGWWLGTGLGLVRQGPDRSRMLQSVDGPISCDVRGLAFDPRGQLWSAGLGGIWMYRGERLVGHVAPADALPSSEVTCVASGPGKVMWVGTRAGAARFDGREWTVRHSRRWLLDDDIRQVALDGAGNAWFATAGGVSELRRTNLTLAAKAAHFHAICESRHVRPPGIVEKCRLRTPGDLSTWEPQDDDNDGGYTAVYLAMESLRYAATQSPQARANAQRSFAALEFLQTVTGTTGFVARTVIPASWSQMADPNESLSPPEIAARRVAEPRFRPAPERWRASADRQWMWKGDTSSDEITAHLFGYFYFYELAADAGERARVRALVGRIVGHILEGGFVLRDVDGQPTRWGVWSPEALLGDPRWAAERGVNAVEILSYLKLAHHVSGEARFEAAYQRLLREHGYAKLVEHPKNLNPAARTHIDDELLAFAYPALIRCERDASLRRLYRRSLDRWHAAVRPDAQPFFEFLYASLTGHRRGLEPAWAVMRDTPLDLVRWTVDNSQREDVRLVRRPELEFWQTGRLLPASERCTLRTDINPRLAVQGDEGRTESDGVFWLLPYWLARHAGLVDAPAGR